MVADHQVGGIININTKQVHHEYHIEKNLTTIQSEIDMAWGHRLYQTREAQYFMLPNKLVMPYSLLSFVQHYQSDAYESHTDNHYTEDYYKLNGATLMHKYMYNPAQLSKMMDDYWKQN